MYRNHILSLLSMNEFVSRDVDRLYVSRRKGGRGLKSVQLAYENLMVAMIDREISRKNWRIAYEKIQIPSPTKKISNWLSRDC